MLKVLEVADEFTDEQVDEEDELEVVGEKLLAA